MPRLQDTPSPRDQLFVALQAVSPHGLLSFAAFMLTRATQRGLKEGLIRWFIRRYGVDTRDSAEPDPRRYPHFNAFFTRALRPGARPLSGDPDEILSPADGVVSQIGDISSGRILQAKGIRYTVASLLDESGTESRHFDDGRFATIYLSPRDYHRVHMPYTGDLVKMRYVPGRLFSVNLSTTRTLHGLFARNERIIMHFDTRIGRMCVVMVGALFVGSLETVWHGRVTPPHGGNRRVWPCPTPGHLERGEELGRFNMGSTVIVLFHRDAVAWTPALRAGVQVRVRETIGRAGETAPGTGRSSGSERGDAQTHQGSRIDAEK